MTDDDGNGIEDDVEGFDDSDDIDDIDDEGLVDPGPVKQSTAPANSAEDDQLDVDEAMRNLIRKRDKRDEAAGRHGPFQRLYRGETTFDFVGRRRTWFTVSTCIIVAGIISIILRGGLNLGIEFKGGTEWTVAAPGVTQTQAVNAVEAAGLTSPVVDLLGSGQNQHLNVQADLNKLSPAAQAVEEQRVAAAIGKLIDKSAEYVDNNKTNVGPTWGGQITNKAITALIVFFIVVGLYISIRFEPKMALAAFIAMVHDVLIAVGIYSLFNFQVTPDTVVAILTILGYSLYDTVVVFDRVRDNTKGIGATGRVTYTQLINLSMNQTLARSINTSMVAILPVAAVLFVGAEILGATTLQDYGLALFVGLLSGAYSSIFIASPVLCMFKERESRWIAIAQRNAKRTDRGGSLSPAAAAALATQMNISAGGQVRTGPQAKPGTRSGPIRPGSASGTAVMDRPTGNGAAGTGSGAGGGSGQSQPRPRKSKGKRQS